MRKSKYFIRLSDEEVAGLKSVLDNPESSKARRTRAEILLCMDGKRSSYTVIDNLSYTYGVSKSFIYGLLDRYTQRGVDSVRKKPSSTPRKAYKVTEEIKQRIVIWMQAPPPQGKRKWTAALLAEKVVEEGLAEKMSYQTIYRLLDKMGLK